MPKRKRARREYEADPVYRLVMSRPIPMKLATNILRQSRRELAPWNIRVLAAFAETGTRKGAALELGITIESVKTSLTQARRILEARNSTHAVAIAIRRGII